MINGAGFPEELREKFWAECALTATKLNNLMIKKEGKNPYEMFYGEKMNLESKLKVFGEIGIEKDYNINLSDKMKNKGGLCAFLGYPEDHPKETFKVFDLKSERPKITRDVKWLNKTYGEYHGKIGVSTLENTELESSDEEIKVNFVKL
jgi:hypothetical protein